MDTLQERFEKDAKRILSTWLKIDNNREILPVWIEFYFWDENNREDEEACHITNDNYDEFKKEYPSNDCYRKHKKGRGGYDINLSNNKYKKEYYSCLLKLCVLHDLKDNSYKILTQTHLKEKLNNFDKKQIGKPSKHETNKPKTALRIGVKKGLINEKRAYYTSIHKYKYYYKYKKKKYRICSKLFKKEFLHHI